MQIPLPLVDIIADQKERCKSAGIFADNLFIVGRNAPLRDTSIENHNKKYATMADLKKIRIHDFRHTHASILANAGINIQEVARRLGHAKIEMTWNTYSHLYPKEEEKAVAVLNNIK